MSAHDGNLIDILCIVMALLPMLPASSTVSLGLAALASLVFAVRELLR